MKKYIFLFAILLLVGAANAQQNLHAFVFDAPSYDDGIASYDGVDKQTLLFGNTSSYHNNTAKPWMIALDSNQKVVLRKTFNNYGYQTERIQSVVKASYGNFIMVGSTVVNSDYNIFIMAVNPMGDVLWAKQYGSPNWDFANKIVQVGSNEFVICGKTYDQTAGGSDAFLMRINAQGDSLNYFQFGGKKDDVATSLTYTDNQQIMVTGYSKSYGLGSKDVFFYRLTENLDSLHFTTLLTKYDSQVNDIIQSYDGKFVIGGFKADSLSNTQNWFDKVDSLGNLLWKRSSKVSYIGEYTSVFEYGPTKALYFVGNSSLYGSGKVDFLVHRMNKDGYVKAGNTFGGSEDDYAFHIRQSDDYTVHLVGYTESFGVALRGFSYIRVDTTLIHAVNPDSVWVVPVGVKQVLASSDELKVYPNPVKDIVNIELPQITSKAIKVELLNSQGQIQYTQLLYSANGVIFLDLSTYARGLYFLSITIDGKSSYSKLILQP